MEITTKQSKDIISALDEHARNFEVEFGLPVDSPKEVKKMQSIIRKILAPKFLKKPLTSKQIWATMNIYGYVNAVVRVDSADLFEGYEFFLDRISEKLVNSDCLSDISFEFVGTYKKDLLVHVWGCVLDMIDNGMVTR